MQVRIYEDSARDRWEDLLSSSKDATWGHLWEWGSAIKDAYGFEPFRLAVEDSRGVPVAAIPFTYVRSLLYGNEFSSLPYLDYGGVCHRDTLDPAKRLAVDKMLSDRALSIAGSLGAKRVHVRSPEPCDSRFEVSTEKVAQHLALGRTVEEQRKKLPSERRNRLKRCDRLGLKTEITAPNDRGAFDEFYSVYSENMRDLGSPTHAVEFFRQIVGHLRERFSLLIIRNGPKAIAAALVFEFRKTIALPWSSATRDARPVYGNNAMFWNAICLGIERGCHTFDFGRSSVGSGIFEFKRQWGPRPVQAYWSTHYFDRGAKAPKQRTELKLASALWRHLPLPVARLVGPPLRRGISN